MYTFLTTILTNPSFPNPYLLPELSSPSEMRTILLLAISLAASCLADSSRKSHDPNQLITNSPTSNLPVLRPCFERYSNHRLVNLRPYHSEWRMRTEDMCLVFCAQSAVRKRESQNEFKHIKTLHFMTYLQFSPLTHLSCILLVDSRKHREETQNQ